MRFRWLHDYWVTIFVLLSISLASLWLAANNKLTLYVHPRYIVFTTLMCAFAVLFIVADAATRKPLPRATQRVGIGRAVVGLVCVALCAALLLTRPAGLTSSAAGQRGINTGALSVESQSSLTDLSDASAAYEQFSVKEWASLLAQTTDAKLFTDKPAHISGFVSPTSDNNPNVFYVARFVVTCCAVDARPIGVPIYHPNWRATYKADQWLEVKGVFIQSPETNATPIVVNPKIITPISEPNNPYVY